MMTREEFFKYIDETFKKGFEVLKKKNHDYAGEDDPFKNFRGSLKVGVKPEKAILVRIEDKLCRLGTLVGENERPEVKDEKIEDTIMDAINYLVILGAYLKSEKDNK